VRFTVKLLGLDLGYSNVKDSDKHIFKSAMTREPELFSNTMEITINEKDTYYVGDGDIITYFDKTNDELTNVLFCTDLALCNANEFFIVTGLPLDQYAKQKDRLKESLLKCDHIPIEYKNDYKIISLKDVAVFPQGACAYYYFYDNGNVVIVDIGSYTINIAYYIIENGIPILKNSLTLYTGMFTLYEKVIKSINRKYDEKFKVDDALNIMKNGLKLDGEQQDLSFLKPLILEYFKPIITTVTKQFPVRSSNVYFIGGGSIYFKDFIKAAIPHAIIPNDAQFSNAYGFYSIAQSMYQKYLEKEGMYRWVNR
jgi:plasmid segregation protein ParM